MHRSPAVLLLVLITAFTAHSQNSLNSTGSKLLAMNTGAGVELVRPRSLAGLSLTTAQAAEREAFDLINRQRIDAGLETLTWNEDLAVVARAHSQSMAANGFFSHRGLDGATVDARVDKFGFHDWRAIGENIAFTRGYDDAAAFAVNRWMQSDSHRKNLLDKRWTESGLGVAILPDGTYFFTQVFILRN